MLFRTKKTMYRLVVCFMLFGSTSIFADEVDDEIRTYQCVKGIDALLNHLDSVLATWLTDPTSPLSVEKLFRDLVAQHPQAFVAAKELLQTPIPDTTNEATLREAANTLHQSYLNKKSILMKLADLDRGLSLTLDSINSGFIAHELILNKFQTDCPAQEKQITSAKLLVASWRTELHKMQSYLGVVQKKRAEVLDAAYAFRDAQIRNHAKDVLNRDLQDIHNMISAGIEASYLYDEIEQWYYGAIERNSRDFHILKQLHEPKANLLTALQKAKAYQARVNLLPSIAGGTKEFLVQRIAFAINHLTKFSGEVNGTTWQNLLTEQTTAVGTIISQDPVCLSYINEFKKRSLHAAKDEGRRAAKAFVAVKKLCGGMP